MAIVLGPKLGLLANANIGENYVDSFRQFLQAIDALLLANTINTITVVPPPTPNNGDAYLLLSTPSGAWAGQKNSIAVWDTQVTNSGTNTTNPSWVFYAPNPGWLVYDVASAAYWYWTGASWDTLLGTIDPLLIANGGTSSTTAAGALAALGAAANGANSDITSLAGLTTPLSVAQGGSGAATVAAGPFAPVSPVNYFTQGYSGQAVNFTANQLSTFNLTLPGKISVSNIGYNLTTDDTSGTNTYSLSLYNSAGTRVATTGVLVGSTFSPGTGFQHQSLTGGPITLPAGEYVVAIACSSATAVLGGASEQFSPILNVNSGTTTGSVPPSTITFPSASWSLGYAPAICLY